MEQCRDHCQDVERRFEILGGFVTPVGDAYGKKGLEKAVHRVNMCKEAVTDSDWIEVDTWESEQEEWKPTLQVLRHIEGDAGCIVVAYCRLTGCVCHACARHAGQLKVIYPDTHVTVIIACGADLLQSFNAPGVWAEPDIKAIFSEFAVACLERDGVNVARLIIDNDVMYAHRQNVFSVPQLVPNAISSTAVRLLLRRGLSTKYLIPDAVQRYIREHRLYGDNSLEHKVGIFQNGRL